jgi:hypothetical protein
VQVEYKRAGQGKSAAVAWCDPTLVPDAAGNLTRALGPLAWCRVNGVAVSLPGDELDMDAKAVRGRPAVDKVAIRARLQVGHDRPAHHAAAPHGIDGYGDALPAHVLPVVAQAPVNLLGEGDLAGLRIQPPAPKPAPAFFVISLSARGSARPRMTAALT